MTKHIPNLQSGLFCVSIISRINGAPIGMEQLRHHFSRSEGNLSPLELARVFKEIGTDATLVEKNITNLKTDFFPVVAELHSGEFVVLARYDKQHNSVLIQRGIEGKSVWQSLAELEGQLTGRLLLLKKDRQKDNAAQEFGLKWFFQAASKYWTILRDCVLASMFVQIFALLSPLVFMIVIDKVLSNQHGWTK